MDAVAHSFNPSPRPRFSAAGLGLVIAAHILVLAALVSLNVIPLPAPLTVLSVSLLPAAPEIRPQPEIVPPRPKPVVRHPSQVAAPAPQPAVPADSPPPAAAVAPVTVTAPQASVASPTPPRFDADYLFNPKPGYPPMSRRTGEQGRVVLRVHVAADGSATDVQINASSGYPRLDESAQATVRRWKFVPARLGQEAIAAWVLVPIAFTLKD